MRKYDTILLDVDGTLLDFVASERLGIAKVLTHFGLGVTDGRLEKYHEINNWYWQAFERGEITKEALVTARFGTFFGEMGLAVSGEEAEAVYRKHLDSSAILICGALSLCEYLSERYGVYIVTNGTSQTQYSRLALSGLDRYVKDIFVSEDAGSQKPDREYFVYCFSRIPGGTPSRTVLIGDSLTSDILGGINAGTATCWYNPSGRKNDGKIVPDYEVRDLEKIKMIL